MSFDFQLVFDSWPLLAKGFSHTLFISSVSITLAFFIGLVVALMRLTETHGRGVIAASYIELIRNTPFLIQVYIVFFVLPAFGIRVGATASGIICLAVYGGAYFAENIRGAILAIPDGQAEAARSLGLSYWQIQRKVIFPQMLGYLIPTTTNLTISLIKDTAILSIITVPELTYMAQIMIAEAFAPVEGFTVIALLYWGLNSVIAIVARKWERYSCRHLQTNDENAKAPVVATIR
ncbi:MAG: amino acid ABC transporter permease [Methyloligellaceae bacterium]